MGEIIMEGSLSDKIERNILWLDDVKQFIKFLQGNEMNLNLEQLEKLKNKAGDKLNGI